jgi:hypothetical protein
MIGLMPAVVDSIDREARIARVRIPGLTDGATELPEAEFCNPVGDKSHHTEIRILPGDDVWLAFVGGDPRYPVIVGYRPRNQENGVDWRRFHHANFQFDADVQFVINAENVIVNAKTIVANASEQATVVSPKVNVNATEQATVVSPKVLVDSPDTTFTGKVAVQGAFSYAAGMTGTGKATMSGSIAMTDGSLTHNGKSIGSDHTHGGVQTGGGKTGTPT